MKKLVMRAMRPGVMPLHERLDRLEARLDATRIDASRFARELEYWRWFIRGGGAERQHGEAFHVLFGRWQRHRLLRLGQCLELPPDDQPGGIDDWCAARSVVEVGPGPYPAVAAARKGWKRAVAIDPLARAFVEEGLSPAAADGVVIVEGVGESLPVPSATADLVICENCLTSVNDPAQVIREMFRVLRPGGHLWLFVDLSDYRDAVRPHAFNEPRLGELLREFKLLSSERTKHVAHPRSRAAMRMLLQRPALAPEPRVYGAARPATSGVEIKVRPKAPVFRLAGQEEPSDVQPDVQKEVEEVVKA